MTFLNQLRLHKISIINRPSLDVMRTLLTLQKARYSQEYTGDMERTSPESKRARLRREQPVRLDTSIQEWPEAGLCIVQGSADPKSSIRIESGRILEMDGRSADRFDSIDRFIASYAINPLMAEEAMAMTPLELARKLFDPQLPAREVRRLFSGLTPARLVEVVWSLDVLEMMLALRKMRLRKQVSNQAHATNLRDHPALLAADAAEAAYRGFSEVETTVGVAALAPLNAIAVLVGSQVGRPGVLTQTAVEESVNLRLALKGLVSYAETLSVYGVEAAFRDGDDTPWSKAFLASAYASRGVKVRFTSGSGSEVLMGHAAGHSMLYLEARCLLVVKGVGSQGVQNGAISCVALPLSLPAGIRGVLAENLLAASLGLEVASGNDALASHSEVRKASKLMLQFLPGTDFITSGYSVMPRQDNLFGGGNFDSNDLDVWTALQRDLQIDGGITPVSEDSVREVRRKAVRAIQAVYSELGFPEISEAETKAAVDAHDSNDLPPRSKAADVLAGERFLSSPATVLDIAGALARRGMTEEAATIVALTRQRAAGDYLQPAGILRQDGDDLLAQSALNDPHEYQGPGTGYLIEKERWGEIKDLPHALDPRGVGQNQPVSAVFQELGPASCGEAIEVVLAVGPAFAKTLDRTLAGLGHQEVVEAILESISQEGVGSRLIRVRDTADCAFIGHLAAQLSGSGIAIGLQSRGTAVIHRRGLAPLDNLELLSQSPNLTLDSYRALGRNAARYALGLETEPVVVRIDNTARLKYIVRTTLFHQIEVDSVLADAPPVELSKKPGP